MRKIGLVLVFCLLVSGVFAIDLNGWYEPATSLVFGAGEGQVKITWKDNKLDVIYDNANITESAKAFFEFVKNYINEGYNITKKPVKHCCPVCGSCERETFRDWEWIEEHYRLSENDFFYVKDPNGNITIPERKEFDNDNFIRIEEYHFHICSKCGVVYVVKEGEK